MIVFPILYKVDDGQYALVFVNAGTFRVLTETDNKHAALDKQDERHLDGMYKPDECPGLWFEPPESLEEQYIRKERQQEVRDALPRLTEAQARRIRAYYFDELSLREIAQVEGVSCQAIHLSIQAGIENLKKFFRLP
jgi:RNA polymerase sigma factor (sigma-70 family)